MTFTCTITGAVEFKMFLETIPTTERLGESLSKNVMLGMGEFPGEKIRH